MLPRLAGFVVLTYLAYKHAREFIVIRQCRRRQPLAEWQRRAALGEAPGFEVRVER